MLLGGASTLLVVLSGARLPLGLDPSALGLVVSAAAFVPVSLLSRPGSSTT
jgi:hypothetical protein